MVEPFLNVALEIAQRWVAARPDRRPRSSGSPTSRPRLADDPDQTTPALRTLAASASLAEHLARLDGAAGDDVDLAWRVATRRAALGQYDEDDGRGAARARPRPRRRRPGARRPHGRPHAEAKDEAWAELFEKRNIPGGPMLGAMIRAFWQPEQDDVLLPYADRFLDEVPALAGGGMLTVFGLMFGMFPQVGDEAFLQRAQDMAADPDVRPDGPGRAADRHRHAGPDASGRGPPEPELRRRWRGPPGSTSGDRRVDDPGEVEPRGREQRGVLLLGALAAARHHQHVEVGERRLHLVAGAAEERLHHEDGAARAKARARRCAGSRRTGRRASRGGSTSAGRRPPPAPPRRSCRSTADHRGAERRVGRLGRDHLRQVEDRPGQVRMPREHGRQQDTLPPPTSTTLESAGEVVGLGDGVRPRWRSAPPCCR